MAKTATTLPKKATRIWGFLIGYGFTPAGFPSRIRPPYYKTDRQDLADAIRKAKGTQELTPIQMEEYEAAQLVIDPARMREKLRREVVADESDRAGAQIAAEKAAAAANTAAQAAEQRANEAADRVKALEAAKVKAETTKTGEEPLFGEDEEEEGGGITLEDLSAMDKEELAGVLELYEIPIPTHSSRATLLTIAQEAVKGNIAKPEEAATE